jgi:hypothetical protein
MMISLFSWEYLGIAAFINMIIIPAASPIGNTHA